MNERNSNNNNTAKIKTYERRNRVNMQLRKEQMYNIIDKLMIAFTSPYIQEMNEH